MGFKVEQKGKWTEVTHLPGYDGFTIRFTTTLVHGKRRASSIQIDAPEGEGLTSQRLGMLPLQQLVDAAMKVADFRLQPDLGHLIRIIQNSDQTGYSDPRAATTTAEVAAVWLEAYGLGRPPRAEVCTRLKISERTADNYIRKAEEQGLIPADLRRQHGKRRPASAPSGTTRNRPERKREK